MNDEFFKVRFFVLVIFMMTAVLSFCQNQISNNYFRQTELESTITNPLRISNRFAKRFENSSFIISNSSLKKYPSLSQVFSFSKKETPSVFSQPKAYSYHDLAFFCKVEVQIEKSTKVPFKFRLGDVRYVDYLEQKIDSPK